MNSVLRNHKHSGRHITVLGSGSVWKICECGATKINKKKWHECKLCTGTEPKKKLTPDKKNKGYFRCCSWDDCPGNKGSRPVKTKAEERLIKAILKHEEANTYMERGDSWHNVQLGILAVLKERKKKK